jgi:hypothetical protein
MNERVKGTGFHMIYILYSAKPSDFLMTRPFIMFDLPVI